MKAHGNKRILALFLASLLLILAGWILAGCIRKIETPLPDTPALDWEHLTEANLTEKLVLRYGAFVFTERRTDGDGTVTESTSAYQVDDAGILSVTTGYCYTAPGPDGPRKDYTNYTFWDGAYTIYAAAREYGVEASGYPEPDGDEGVYPGNSLFFYNFYDTGHTVTGETADAVTFRGEPEILEGEYYVCTVDRESLALLDYALYDPDGTLRFEQHVSYGRDKAEPLMAPLLKDVHDQRIVRYHVLWGENGSSSEYELFLHLPCAWRFTLVSYSGDLYVYGNEGWAGAAENRIDPGSEDLTFWVTNIPG